MVRDMYNVRPPPLGLVCVFFMQGWRGREPFTCFCLGEHNNAAIGWEAKSQLLRFSWRSWKQMVYLMCMENQDFQSFLLIFSVF